MTLSDGDKAECKEIAREIIKEVLAIHIETCPHGKALMRNKMFLIGACIGSGIGSGGVTFALAKVLMSL